MTKLIHISLIISIILMSSCNNYTPNSLFKAIQKDDVKEVGEILTKVKLRFCQNERGENPLLFAIRNGSYNTSLYLISKMQDFSFCDESGNNALFFAVNYGKDIKCNIINALIKKGIQINQFHPNEEYSVFGYAAMKGDTTLMKFLLNKGADINLKKDDFALSPLYLAVTCGRKSSVSFLVNSGADLYSGSAYGNNVIELAVATNQFEIFKMLLELHIMKVDRNVLDVILNCNRLDMIQYVISNNLISSIELQEAMFQVSDPEVCSYLLNSGFDVNYMNKEYGITLLHFACINGDVEMIKYLLAHGANVNLLSPNNYYTPLMYASLYYEALYSGESSHTAFDFESAVSIKVKLGFSETKTIETSLASVKELVNKGANISFENKYKESALSLALSCENEPVVEFISGFSLEKK